LRSVGRVRVEIGLLLLERVLFTGVACGALALGAGPLVALGIYAATNGVTAILVTLAAHRLKGGDVRPAGRLLDAEGRRTAVASSLVIVGPRVSAVLVVLLSTPTAVGSFAVAQKAPEALSLLGIAILTTALPLLRAHTVARHPELALQAGVRVTSAVLAALLPVVGVIVARPTEVIELLYGTQDRPGAATASVLLAVASFGWIVRTFGELLLLAEERAATYVRAVLAGTIVTVVLGIALIPSTGVEGGAWAALVGELTVLSVVVGNTRGIVGGAALRAYAIPVAFGAGAAATAAAVGGQGRVAVAGVIAAWVLAGAVYGRSILAALDREHDIVTA
jgi:O-antigen/teichoic acid export membrane protein